MSKKNNEQIKTDIDFLKELIKTSEMEIEPLLIEFLYKNGYNSINYITDSYIFAKGSLPVCLVAHYDTVFDQPPVELYYDPQEQVMWSPQGAGFDDRAGIYSILKIIKMGYKPSILFLDREESGGLGAKEFVNNFDTFPTECNFFIELDRQGVAEAVFYNCGTSQFKKFICNFGFEEEQGTFSDISVLMPHFKICGVNLAIGYIDEHTFTETLYISAMETTILSVIAILKDSRINNNYVYKYKNDMLSYSYLYSTIDTCVYCGTILNKDNDSGKKFKYKNTYWGSCKKCNKEFQS